MRFVIVCFVFGCFWFLVAVTILGFSGSFKPVCSSGGFDSCRGCRGCWVRRFNEIDAKKYMVNFRES